MKLNLTIAAGILAANTFALDTKFGIGLELSNTVIDATRATGAQIEGDSSTAFAFTNGAAISSAYANNHQIGAKKSIAGLKLTADTKFSSSFAVQGAISINGGSIDLNHQKTGIYYLASGNASAYGEFLRLRIKPSYAVSIRGLFSLLDSFKFGPELRIQQYKSSTSGKIASVAVNGQLTGNLSIAADGKVNQTDNTGDNDVLFTNAAGDSNNSNAAITLAANGSYTAQVTQALTQANILAASDPNVYNVVAMSTNKAEALYGIAASGMVNEFIRLNMGYLTARVHKHQFKVDQTITDDVSKAMTGLSANADTFSLEDDAPSISQYYLETSMYF